MDTIRYPSFPLAELHAHFASSINPAIYWQIAHDQGLILPKREFNEFINHVTLTPDHKMSIKEYFDEIYHPILDKLSSGTFASEKAVYEIMSGAYRNNITLIELRTNPMKHNAGGKQDLDHIIMAMLRGMERALLEYTDLRAGFIFCMDRHFPIEQNEIILEKALKYQRRGVVGIDFANYGSDTFHFKDYASLIQKAKDAGLKVTAHSGETNDTNDMWDALEYAKPSRIGHGIKAAYDKKLMEKLAEDKVVLEVCPLSNIMTKAVENTEELKFIIRTFVENNVLFTINTDWPEIIQDAHLWRQFEFLKENNILSEEELETCNKIAFNSTFIPEGGLSAYL